MAAAARSKQDPKPGRVPIFIDGHRYIAPARELSGAELRALSEPPVGDDRDLWLDADGDLDNLVEAGESVPLSPNMRFFTVPRVINPGSLCTRD